MSIDEIPLSSDSRIVFSYFLRLPFFRTSDGAPMEARSARFVLMQYRLFFARIARIACKFKQQGARDNETAIARSTRDPINRVPHAHAALIEQRSQRAANSNPYRPSLFVCSAGTVSDYQLPVSYRPSPRSPLEYPGDPALPPLPPCNFSGSSFKIFFESADLHDLTIRNPTSLSPPSVKHGRSGNGPHKEQYPPPPSSHSVPDG